MTGATGPVKFKVFNSYDDIKDFLKDTMDDISKVKVADPVKATEKLEVDQEEEGDKLDPLL